MVQNQKEQRASIRLLAGMWMKAKQIHNSLVFAHGNGAYSLTSVHRWMQRFMTNNDVDDRPRSGRPTKITGQFLQDLQAAVRRQPPSSLAQLSTDLGVSVGTVHKALRKCLGFTKRPSRWIPHLLTDPQCQRRVNVCRTLLRMNAQNRDFLHSIVTMDESWFFVYDPHSRQASCQWLAPGATRPQIPCLERATVKVMLSIFWDSEGVLLKEFVADGRGIDADLHLVLLRQLREKIRRKRPARWACQNGRIQQDNAPTHRARLVQNHLQRRGTPAVPHPGYSLDLAPSDYWLFNRIKCHLCGRRFANIAELQIQPHEFAHATLASMCVCTRALL